MYLYLAAAIAFSASACVEADGFTVDEPEPDHEETSVVAQLGGPVTMERDEPMEDADICGLLPCEGPCSLACDPEALVAKYVPNGTCVVFACTLTDGRTVGVHACKPGD